MTSNKDLEERLESLENVTNFNWWLGVLLSIAATIIIVWVGLSIYHDNYAPVIVNRFDNRIVLESTSPCELGLMEWEYETPLKLEIQKVEIMGKDRHYCNETEYGFVCKGMNETRIYTNKTKSCPYSGPGIMVVKG